RILKKISMLVLRCILRGAGNITISSINYSIYGVFATNDRTKTAFDDVVSLFIKIDYEDADPDLDETRCLRQTRSWLWLNQP
ncbi:MAG: hypothetical protein LIO75_03340, partial [Lachnospiraceae bacterium]|nr:hypothetical protein [Lachnospiraceae bacterium]